jgi:hypothetical protein
MRHDSSLRLRIKMGLRRSIVNQVLVFSRIVLDNTAKVYLIADLPNKKSLI